MAAATFIIPEAKLDAGMKVESFIPVFPSVKDFNFEYEYEKMEEFRSLTLGEELEPRIGTLFKHQELFKRMFCPFTQYNRAMVFHEVGSGKGCIVSAVGELYKSSSFIITPAGVKKRRTLILVKNEQLKNQTKRVIYGTCTVGIYGFKAKSKTKIDKDRLLAREVDRYYEIDTFFKFFKKLKAFFAEDRIDELVELYSNRLILVDEIHHVRDSPELKGDKTTNVTEVYGMFKQFFRILKNVKILLFTATPMWDRPSEIASLMNFLLSESDEILYSENGDQFENYLYLKTDSYPILREEVKRELAEKFKGKLSYLRSPKTDIIVNNVSHISSSFTDEEKDYITNIIDEMKNIDFVVHKMTERQITGMSTSKAYNLNNKFPPIPAGKTGEQWLKEIFIEEGNENVIDFIDAIRFNYSEKYAYVMERLRVLKGKAFVYFEDVTGVGAKFFGEILSLMGWENIGKRYRPRRNSSPRFVVMTGDTETAKDDKSIREFIKTFNSIENLRGDDIKVIVGSRMVSEGLTFKHVREVHIMEPWWNFSPIDQAIGRCIRIGTHSELPIGEREISIFKHATVYGNVDYLKRQFIDVNVFNDKTIGAPTSDLQVYYRYCFPKDYMISLLKQFMITQCFDCLINYNRNKLPAKFDDKRECNYALCDYKCAGFDYEDDVPITGKADSTNLFFLYYTGVANSIHIEEQKHKIEYLCQTKDIFSIDIESEGSEREYMILAIHEIIGRGRRVKNRWGVLCKLREVNGVIYVGGPADNPEIQIVSKSLKEVSEETRFRVINSKDLFDSIDSLVDIFKEPESLILFENQYTKSMFLEKLFEYLYNNDKDVFKLTGEVWNYYKKEVPIYIYQLEDQSIVNIYPAIQTEIGGYDRSTAMISFPEKIRIFKDGRFEGSVERWGYLKDLRRGREIKKDLEGYRHLQRSLSQSRLAGKFGQTVTGIPEMSSPIIAVSPIGGGAAAPVPPSPSRLSSVVQIELRKGTYPEEYKSAAGYMISFGGSPPTIKTTVINPEDGKKIYPRGNKSGFKHKQLDLIIANFPQVFDDYETVRTSAVYDIDTKFKYIIKKMKEKGLENAF